MSADINSPPDDCDVAHVNVHIEHIAGNDPSSNDQIVVRIEHRQTPNDAKPVDMRDESAAVTDAIPAKPRRSSRLSQFFSRKQSHKRSLILISTTIKVYSSSSTSSNAPRHYKHYRFHFSSDVNADSGWSAARPLTRYETYMHELGLKVDDFKKRLSLLTCQSHTV